MIENTKKALRAVSASSQTFLRNMIAQQEIKHQQLIADYGPDYDTPAMRFSLNKAEVAVVAAWVESLKPEIMAIQGKAFDTISPGEPYYGAIGGGVTYSFMSTGLGEIIIAKESITGKELNVSDALDWFFFG